MATPPPLADAEPFRFKKFFLGMSIYEFRKLAEGPSVWIEFAEANDKGKIKNVKRSVTVPLCTDSIAEFPGSSVPDPVEGEVVCNISPGNFNAIENVVAEGPVTQTLYRFAGKRLYRIDIQFASVRYPVIRSAFKAKYGPPTSISSVDFQNAYSAKWQGEVARWVSGEQSIMLYEGSNNGPGQDEFNPYGASATFEQRSLRPSSTYKPPVDF